MLQAKGEENGEMGEKVEKRQARRRGRPEKLLATELNYVESNKTNQLKRLGRYREGRAAVPVTFCRYTVSRGAQHKRSFLIGRAYIRKYTTKINQEGKIETQSPPPCRA